MSSPADVGDQVDLFAVDRAVPARARKLTPKRPQSDTAGLADVFPYYAGFSFDWAQTQLQANKTDAPVVLDPWNGSGTTTLAARSNGIRSIGLDLNPIANVVAQLRVQVGNGAERCEPPKYRKSTPFTDDDPLLHWFSLATTKRLRDWTRSLRALPRSRAAIGYVSLFRVVRRLTDSFEGSNPTWVRRASGDDALVDLDRKELDKLIVEDQFFISTRLTSEVYADVPTSIITGSSTCLPLADQTVDLILTSPPYLTRIDYAVAYSRELAVLGINVSRDRTLRSSLMGTTLIRPQRDLSDSPYGSIASQLLQDVSSHQSKASSGYYLKQTRQYLDDLVASLDEITRVAKSNAVMKLVVQDSYYKDIPIRLAEICVEEAELRGWHFSKWDQTEVSRTLTQVNTAARAYEKGKVHETVMKLVKG
ncbi:hypothetical protein ABT352_03265 [Streptosporangium sp. NPDC000563]|uniref:hypothetical protein n=1 Tax=Streptosporangium sp. NPDC000563 TaxID=3154366 RepID=UPI00333095DE